MKRLPSEILVFRITFLLFCLSLTALKSAESVRKAFFEALSGDSEQAVDKVLASLGNQPDKDIAKAYEGGMLMRKADFQKAPPRKLNMFKRGHRLLEDVIARNPQQAEFRFIRLCVQENAPKMLKYRGDMEADRELIVLRFGELSDELKSEIRKYARRSQVLDPGDLK